MKRGLEGPVPNDRAEPTGRRTADGVRLEAINDDDNGRRAVLSATIENDQGGLAKVVSMFDRRKINVERLMCEPLDEEHSRITLVVEPPHPGINNIIERLEKLQPVLAVEELKLDVARHLTIPVD